MNARQQSAVFQNVLWRVIGEGRLQFIVPSAVGLAATAIQFGAVFLVMYILTDKLPPPLEDVRLEIPKYFLLNIFLFLTLLGALFSYFSTRAALAYGVDISKKIISKHFLQVTSCKRGEVSEKALKKIVGIMLVSLSKFSRSAMNLPQSIISAIIGIALLMAMDWKFTSALILGAMPFLALVLLMARKTYLMAKQKEADKKALDSKRRSLAAAALNNSITLGLELEGFIKSKQLAGNLDHFIYNLALRSRIRALALAYFSIVFAFLFYVSGQIIYPEIYEFGFVISYLIIFIITGSSFSEAAGQMILMNRFLNDLHEIK